MFFKRISDLVFGLGGSLLHAQHPAKDNDHAHLHTLHRESLFRGAQHLRYLPANTGKQKKNCKIWTIYLEEN